jgi:alkanesulfonate monooxygenase SsuD/methylene tetrahydromethanopterin reductase-like flavin-dependent oxidoreductase (luciferase family)
VLSGGRARLGVGAGYHAQEAADMGLPLPPTRERFEHLEDTLRLARRMFDGDDSAFTGHHHRLRPINSPAPLQRPSILVGGTGERRTLRLVAQFADACNVFDIPDGGATISRKLAVLAGHCAELGRDPSGIEKTVSTRLDADETPDAFTKRCRALAGLGIEHAIVLCAGPWTASGLATLAAARPMLEPVEAGVA